MNRWFFRLFVFAAALLAFPSIAPAPLVFRPGEGWVYEKPGEQGNWTRARAREQLEVAQKAFDNREFNVALKAARRVVKVWPMSDYAPQAQYLMGRAYEGKRMDERAFKQYQQLLESYPKVDNYEEVLQRQYDIAQRFLGGQWFKLWGYIPFFPSMDKTSDMFEKVIQNGPYSDVAPRAQMSVGAARENQKEWNKAVRAYERAADRYSDRSAVSADALFRAGLAHHKQARTAEYDQNAAAQAIATFTDFITLFPQDPRVAEAQELIAGMRYEQARGSFAIAQFYEKRRKYEGALIYYNEVIVKDPSSSMAKFAQMRIADIKQKTSTR